MGIFNFLENVAKDRDKEIYEEILKLPNIRVERIISNGQSSQENFWYDQDENEMVLLLEGEARLEFEDEVVVLKKGDFINIYAHKKHRVKSTSEIETTIWLAIFYK